jgi:hypothetical protein
MPSLPSLRTTLLVVGAFAAALLLAPLLLISPYLLDDWRLDRLVVATALDWRDFGREKAETRLAYELDREHIGMQVTDESCELTQTEEGTRMVGCAWDVDVEVPFSQWTIPLSFSSQARVLAEGTLQ